MATSSRTIPGPGQIPNARRDALLMFETVRSGGVGIGPSENGYALMACSDEAIEKAFASKNRLPNKSRGMYGNLALQREIHRLSDEKFEMIRVLVEDFDLPIMAVAPFNPDHPILQKLARETLESSAKDGAIAIFLGGGLFVRELVRLTTEAGLPMLGSSANSSGKGQKYAVEDVEEGVKEVADLIVDYGRQRYHTYKTRASIIFDFGKMEVIRMGNGYELFREKMKKFWGVDLPEDPEYKF